MMEKNCVEARVSDFALRYPLGNARAERVILLSFTVDKPFCVVDPRRDGKYEFRKTKKPGLKVWVDVVIFKRNFKKINLKRILNGDYFRYDYRYSPCRSIGREECSYYLQISTMESIPAHYVRDLLSEVTYTYTLRMDDIKDPTNILRYLLKTKEIIGA